MKSRGKGGAWALPVLAALLVGGAPAAGQAGSGRADAVREREIAFAGTMAARDHAAFLTFVSDEAVFFNGNDPLRGAVAIGEAWAPFFTAPAAPFSWHPDVVEVLDSGRLALTSGPVRNPAGEVVGRFNSIWRLEADGVWRVVFDKGS